MLFHVRGTGSLGRSGRERLWLGVTACPAAGQGLLSADRLVGSKHPHREKLLVLNSTNCSKSIFSLFNIRDVTSLFPNLRHLARLVLWPDDRSRPGLA